MNIEDVPELDLVGVEAVHHVIDRVVAQQSEDTEHEYI